MNLRTETNDAALKLDNIRRLESLFFKIQTCSQWTQRCIWLCDLGVTAPHRFSHFTSLPCCTDECWLFSDILLRCYFCRMLKLWVGNFANVLSHGTYWTWTRRVSTTSPTKTFPFCWDPMDAVVNDNSIAMTTHKKPVSVEFTDRSSTAYTQHVWVHCLIYCVRI